MQQGQKPLQPVEFIGSLAKSEPIYREEEEAYVGWYAKTPMGKKRGKYLEGDDEDAKKEKKNPTKRSRYKFVKCILSICQKGKCVFSF